MTDDRIIDMAAIDSIRDIGGEELLGKLIELFDDYVAGRIAAARTSLACGDLTGVQDAVHPVKSSAANLGAQQVRELARQIEQLARTGNGAPIPSLLARLESSFHAARGRLKALPPGGAAS